MYNDVNYEANAVIAQIKRFWGTNVSNIQIKEITDEPYNMFTLSLTLYGNKQVLAEYERSTLGFYIFLDGKYVGLSKLTNDLIYRGFDSYSSQDNILHNFQVLDKVLQSA
jgi:hypothetical protein